MLDLFVIFSKGGIVLWWFQEAGKLLSSSISPVNALVKSVILQEKSAKSVFQHDKLALKYMLDNEFELVFVVAYQNQLQLLYVDKFLTDIQREFRDKYKNDLLTGNVGKAFNFEDNYRKVLKNAQEKSRLEASVPKLMRTFEQSEKSKKSVGSMITSRSDLNAKAAAAAAKPTKGKEQKKPEQRITNGNHSMSDGTDDSGDNATDTSEANDVSIEQKRAEFFKKKMGGSIKKSITKPEQPKKKGKEARIWDLGGTNKDIASLDLSNSVQSSDNVNVNKTEMELRGQMAGSLKDLEAESESEPEEENDAASQNKSSGYGFFNVFKSLSVSKTLTKESLQPVLEKMKDHLIAKNVAADIAQRLCDSVAVKLEGKILGTFSGVASTVKNTLQESCVQILSPQRRIDILRDAMDSKQKGQPYCITFCGVNGVGKSTNLSKVAFWLIENGFSVLIAACDTFRAGAVEQLRTHTLKLNKIHPPSTQTSRNMVTLYEKGYDKDAASIAMCAIGHARDTKHDVVLIDTAGRMQDNEPLMKSLAKLIKVNQPDLVLFVGEALVGNEAVDQLTKFNQALADHSQQENPHLIDGIVLTKFDTIDDKVGAAVSMTYITGQPIVFVGTGQTYTDLKTLNAKAVVTALMKD